MRARIIVADENESYLRSLRRLLEREFRVIATVRDGAKVPELAASLDPDVILLSLVVGTRSGLDVTREIASTLGAIKVIILSMHTDRAYIEEAFEAGASGFLLKSSSHAELLTAIRHVIAGATYVGTGLWGLRAPVRGG